MEGLPQVAAGILLVALTVVLHSAGTISLLWIMVRRKSRVELHFGYRRNAAVLTFVVLWLLSIHFVEVGCWGVGYVALHCFPDIRSAIYFSLTSYSTVGYGDVLLERQWRMLGGVEALVGMMMIAWSTALMLAAVTWIHSRLIAQWTRET